MDTLQSMKVFVRVAQRTGFAAASRDLRMSPATVTKHVAESRVGARLFDRTTRRVNLTEAGQIYLEHCLECLNAFEDADTAISELSKEPKGLLRVAAPVDLGNEIAVTIARLLREYPRIKVELQLSNRPVDLVEEGVDVAVRVAASLDGRYVARPVAVAGSGFLGRRLTFESTVGPADRRTWRSIAAWCSSSRAHGTSGFSSATENPYE